MQTSMYTELEGKTNEKIATAWKISDTEWFVKIPARYREYTQKYRVFAIYRRYGKITHYQYKVTARELKQLESLFDCGLEEK